MYFLSMTKFSLITNLFIILIYCSGPLHAFFHQHHSHIHHIHADEEHNLDEFHIALVDDENCPLCHQQNIHQRLTAPSQNDIIAFLRTNERSAQAIKVFYSTPRSTNTARGPPAL